MLRRDSDNLLKKIISFCLIRTVYKLYFTVTALRNLREVGALSPDGAVVSHDGCGGELEAGIAVDIAHQVLVDVCLPRHFAFALSLVLTRLRSMDGVVALG